MKYKKFSVLVFVITSLTAQNTYQVYFNEVRTKDQRIDNIEFIELIGPSGINLSGFTIEHRNGRDRRHYDGIVWSHSISSFTIPNDCATDGIGFFVYGASKVTNVDDSDGWTDEKIKNYKAGLILKDPQGDVIDAIAWGGKADWVGGDIPLPGDDPGAPITTAGAATADSYLHIITPDGPANYSTQAPDSVFSDAGSGWTVVKATPGAINKNQICSDVALPVELSSFTVETTPAGYIHCKWVTESEIENQGFILERCSNNIMNWIEIASFLTNQELQGQGSITHRTKYSYIDNVIESGITYEYRLGDVDYNGVITYHSTRTINIENDSRTIINYPNPFNPSTTIRYSIPMVETHSDAFVYLAIYDISGKLVTTLVNKEQSSGWHEVQWNGTNQTGEEVPGGVYLSRVTVGNEVKTNKLILLK